MQNSRGQTANAEVALQTANQGGNDLDLNVDASAPKAKVVTKEEMAARRKENAAAREKLDERDVGEGHPDAKLADPVGQQVTPRYNIVQNRSENILIFPDLRNINDPTDRGLVLKPGEVTNLTDFYTPMEINRSRGLKRAATEMAGVSGQKAMVVLKSEEEGMDYVPPKKAQHAPGTVTIDEAPNDFDLRFEELELRDAKREAKLLQKTIGTSLKSRAHAQA